MPGRSLQASSLHRIPYQFCILCRTLQLVRVTQKSGLLNHAGRRIRRT